MKKTLLAAAVAALALSPAAMAQNYQMEAGLTYTNIDPDTAGAEKDSAIALDFKYHFEQVETMDRPLNEAAFLGHNSNVSLKYKTVDKAKEDVISLGAEAWFEAFYAAVGVDMNQPDVGDDTTDIDVKLGYMLQDNWRVHLSYNITEADDSTSDDVKNIGIGTKYVAQLDGGTALNLEAGLAKADDDDDTLSYDLAADYYFTQAISAGLSYGDSDADDTEATIGINGKYFVTPLISLEAGYTTTKDDEDTISLRAAMRF